MRSLASRAGNWTFVAEAPGFQSQFNEMNIMRTQTPNPPLIFSLQKAVVRPSAAVEGLSSKDLQRQLAAAEVLFNQQKFEEAVVIYRGILEAAPSLAVVNLQIGAAYRSIKQYDQAIGAYTALLSADPGNAKAAVGAAMADLEKGDEQAAERLLMTAAETSTDRDVFYQLAELKTRKNQTDEAMKWYRKAADADASWGKPLFKLGSIARSRGDRQTAVDTMARVIAVDPTSPEAAQAKVVLNELKQ